MAEKIDEREAAILARMTESRGALNRQQAELAVDLQTNEDDAKAADAPKKKKGSAAE